MTVRVEVAADGREVVITWPDGVDHRFNRFWLWDNRPGDGDRSTLFRDRSVADLPDDLAITDCGTADCGTADCRTADCRTADCSRLDDGVSITFSDGTVEVYDVDWLRDHATFPPLPAVRPWRAGHRMTRIGADCLTPRSPAHLELLEEVAARGAVLVDGVPDDGTEDLARLLGHIRHTDFGRLFDIVVEPEPFTPSQSPSALDPHTDDPYRYTPSGISILHCVTPSAGHGGASIVVDGFAVAESMAEIDPAGFELLTTVAIPFVHRRGEAVDQGDDVHLRAAAPIIAMGPDGQPAGIRFHERSMAPLQLDPDLTDRFYRALMGFARLVRDPALHWRHKLEAGEALVYDNQRVLHGRTGFEGSQSRRHIRLCTVDRDQVHSRLRRLREQHGTGTESDPLPAGNLS